MRKYIKRLKARIALNKKQFITYSILHTQNSGHFDSSTLHFYTELRESGDMYSFSYPVSPAIPF